MAAIGARPWLSGNSTFTCSSILRKPKQCTKTNTTQKCFQHRFRAGVYMNTSEWRSTHTHVQLKSMIHERCKVCAASSYGVKQMRSIFNVQAYTQSLHRICTPTFHLSTTIKCAWSCYAGCMVYLQTSICKMYLINNYICRLQSTSAKPCTKLSVLEGVL